MEEHDDRTVAAAFSIGPAGEANSYTSELNDAHLIPRFYKFRLTQIEVLE